MIKTTAISQPGRIQTRVTAKGSTLSVSSTSTAVRVTQVTQGLTGQPGDTLPGTGDSSYRHDQSPAAVEWVIDHNLGKWPSVTIIDSAGDEVEGEVNFVNQNRVIATFSAAFSGSAFVN